MAFAASSHPKGFCFIPQICLADRSLRNGSSLGLMAMRRSGPIG
jgi:hypothetical protein